MNTEKIKSSELVIIKNILAWQVSQTLGVENETELKKHALLLAVDYEEDSFFPLMIGNDFSPFLDELKTGSWKEKYQYIVDSYIQTEHDALLNFFSKEAAEVKWKKGIEYDSTNFISHIVDAPKWTHAVQHLFFRDGHLHAIYWIVEIDNFRKTQNAVHYLAEHDALTGVYNRYHLDKVREELEQNKKEAFFVFLDLDDFKQVNDTYGHGNGDLALIAFTEKLEEAFYHKTNDMIFRLGGDEFLAICINCSEQVVIDAIEKMNVPIPVQLEDGSSTTIRCSIGYATNIKDADKALYSVKENGKNNFKKG
ncbi:MAG: GGDEF domain-containing protein [Bacilli bacterium]|nr:GGDEF domain-containing protein [Bacilli bacterium]